MKQKFIWAYRLNSEEIKNIFNNCQFFFEANTLLRLFSIKKDIATKIVGSISRYKDRITIPYHVAEEYHWHLIEHYTDKIATTQKQINKLNPDTLFNEIFINTFLNYLPEEDQPEYKKLVTSFCESAKEILNKRLSECNDDFNSMEIANSLSHELSGCILDSLTDEELQSAYQEYPKRAEAEIPPGYKDKKKSETGKKRMGKTNEAGDYIIWLEIIKWVKANKKNVILVSNEKKPDWIWDEHGFRIGPRWELRKEFYDASEGKLFHIINLNDFLSLTADDYTDLELKATEEDTQKIPNKESSPKQTLYHYTLEEVPFQEYNQAPKHSSPKFYLNPQRIGGIKPRMPKKHFTQAPNQNNIESADQIPDSDKTQ